MTQEDKDLLIKDLCARLPYNVRVEHNGTTLTNIFDVLGIAHGRIVLCLPFMSKTECPLIEEVKPYLFPLLSMTEEERIAMGNEFAYGKPQKALDILHKRHIDYRGLIPMGLAIDATGLNIY